MSNPQTKLLIGMLYRQVTGGMFVVRGFAEHEETGEEVVFYSSIRTGKVFYRTIEQFNQIERNQENLGLN